MKIITINQGHTDNYGDIAINEAISSIFDGEDVRFFPFWEESVVYGRLAKHRYLKALVVRMPVITEFLNNRRINKSLANIVADAAIIGGGELLSAHKGFNLSLYAWVAALKKRGIPVYIIGVSGNDDLKKRQFARNRKAIEMANEVIVRDGYTKKIFADYYDKEVECAPDVVFCAYSGKNSSTDKRLRNRIVLCPIEPSRRIIKALALKNIDEYIDYCIEISVEEMNDQCSELVVAPTVKTDSAIAEKIFNKAKERRINVKYISYSNLNKFRKVLENTSVVVSARMHGMILGLNMGCKIKPIRFKQKLITFGEEYGNIGDSKQVSQKARAALKKVKLQIMKGNTLKEVCQETKN